MRVGFVVLYVKDVAECETFWTEKIDMVVKKRSSAGEFEFIQVGFADQPFAFELVPLEMMKENPDGLDLATPSIAFNVENLEQTRAKLIAAGVQATEPGEHSGVTAFAFSDNEGRWFAVIGQ